MVSKEARKYVEKEIRNYKEYKLFNRDSFETLNTMRFRNVVEFITIFDQVYKELPDEKQKMIALLYWSTKHLNCNGVGMIVNADGSTIGRWRNDVLNEISERLGLS